jgi:Domain of unknown function (DUF4178)
VLLWILIALIATLAGAAGTVVIGAQVANRRRLGGGGATALALPDGDHHVERTIRDLRTGDVLTIDNKDFIVEGVVTYDEDGHRWIGARVVDAGEVRWLVVGLERSGSLTVRMCTEDTGNEISGYPPEALVLGEQRYALDKRGTATCKLDGDLGTLAARTGGKIANSVERCRWWLYNAPGDDTAVIEQWGADYRILRGKKVPGHTIDLMQGS